MKSPALRHIGALLFGVFIAVLFGVYTARASETRFGGVLYTWPTSHGVSGKLLATNGSKTLTWDGAAGVPSVIANIVMYTAGACPTGWAGYGDSGEYFVGLVSGGTDEGQVGTDLSSSENRPTGLHAHTSSGSLSVSASPHSHSVTDPGHAHGGEDDFGSTGLINNGSGTGLLGDGSTRNGSVGAMSVAASISIDNTDGGAAVTGSSANIADSAGTAGTNAPYIILRACKKS